MVAHVAGSRNVSPKVIRLGLKPQTLPNNSSSCGKGEAKEKGGILKGSHGLLTALLIPQLDGVILIISLGTYRSWNYSGQKEV